MGRILLTLLSYLALFSGVCCLLLGSFNIQVFGKTKASKAHVMDVLVRIISRYDLLLIQEIRDSDGNAIEKLLIQVNAANSGNPFKMKLSDRLGRTTSKEQYAFFYREAAGLTVLDDYVYADTKDVFEREPYIVTFKSSRAGPKQFVLVGIHVDPDDAVQEIAHLSEVFAAVKRDHGTNNIMVLGDLNADCRYVPAYRWKEIPLRADGNYHWPIHDEIDTTVSNTNCAYDRFIYTGFRNEINPASAGVFKFDDEYMLEPTAALEVSDHYPIELELSESVSRAEMVVAPIVLVLLLGFGALFAFWR